MRPRPAFYVLLVVVLSGTAALINRAKHPVHRDYDLVPVVVFEKDVPAGALIQLEDLGIRAFPSAQVFSSTVKPDAASEAVGKRLKSAYTSGEPVRWSDVGGPDPFPALAKRGRAVTIDVDPHRAVDGRVEPADHIDVLATFKDPQTNELVSTTVLQNAVVLSVTHRAAPEPDSVTLLVIGEEADALALGQDLGHYSIALRNPEDNDLDEDRGRTTINTLLSGERRKTTRCARQVIPITRVPMPEP